MAVHPPRAPSVEVGAYATAAAVAGSPADLRIPAPDVETARYVLACVAAGSVTGIPAPTVELAEYMRKVIATYSPGVTPAVQDDAGVINLTNDDGTIVLTNVG